MTYSLHCQDMDDEVFEELDDALEAGDAVWSHMTEKEQMACEILEVWDDDADADKGPEYNWPAEGPRGSWEITPHPDALMVEAPSGESYTVPCRTKEDVWDALAAYDNDHGTKLWDWITPHNVDMKRHDDDLLLGCDMKWVFGDCDVVLDSDSLDFKIIMDGPQGKRLKIVPGFHVYDDVKALDEGSSPIRDQWEDGNGNTVCYEEGTPCDADGEPLPENDAVCILLGRNLVVLEVPRIEENSDVWNAIAEYDEAHGTDLYDALDEKNVLGVNIDEYRTAPRISGIATRTVTGSEAREVVEKAWNTVQWDNDGEDEGRWYAVQKGITADGWPMVIRYSFPLGFEPETDEDCHSHIQNVVVTEPADQERTPEQAIEEGMPDLIMRFGLSPREAQAVILSDMGMGPQEIADTLGRMLGTSMTRQSITNALRKARTKMAIDKED